MLVFAKTESSKHFARKTIFVDNRRIDCFYLDVANNPPGYSDWDLLSANEKARARRLLRQADRHRFTQCRATLRRLLAGYLNESPKKLELASGRWGKPYLRSGKLKFNLSHSGTHAVYAFSSDTEVGIDIELVSPSRGVFDMLVNRVLTPMEQEMLWQVNAAMRTMYFLDLWMAKEALFKYLGCGFSLDPANVMLEFRAGMPVGFKTESYRNLNLTRVKFFGDAQKECFLVS